MRLFHNVVLATALVAAVVQPVAAQDARQRRPATSPASRVRPDAPRPGGPLRALIEVAQARSPAVRAAELRVEAARGELRQSRAYPNPEFLVEAENFGGSGQYRGVRSLETTVSIAQQLEVNGARTARLTGAQAALAVAERELDIARLDAVRDVTIAYAALVKAARDADVERERARLAAEVVRATQDRMIAGRDPLVELRRAEVAQAHARISVDRAGRAIETARRALATAMGLPVIDVSLDDAWFEAIGPAPLAASGGPAATAPDIARLQAEVERNRAALAAERANALPNPTVRGGIRNFQDTRDNAAVFSLSIPIPIPGSNRGAIDRAGADLTRSEVEMQQATITLTATLADARLRLDLAWREADAIRRVILPAAREAYSLAREGYSSGRFNLIETLDAQRTLTEARLQLNTALLEFHNRRTEAERLEARGAIQSRPQGEVR